MGLRALVFLVAAVAGTVGAHADEREAPEMAIIVNSKNPTRALAEAELGLLFASSRRSWSDGQAVVCFNLPPGHPLRVEFDRAVLHMEPDEVGRFWIDQRIRGTAKPPRQVEDPQIMLHIVARLPGAIGYVPATLVDGSVNVVARVRRGKVTPP